MQIRNTADAPGPAPNEVLPGRADTAILDAARRLILSHGISKTTLTDVAREAGLSRMTVYRRWDGLPQVLGATMQREWSRLLDLEPQSLVRRAEEAASLREFLIAEVVGAGRTLRESELLRAILAAEPELLLPYLVVRPGAMHSSAIMLVATGIERGQNDGSIRSGDPQLLATSVVLATQSWVLSLDAGGAGQPRAALDAELHALLDAYLRPVA